MQVSPNYVAAVKNWQEVKRVEVPERAIEFLAYQVTEARRAITINQGRSAELLSERKAIYLTAQEKVPNFVELLANLSGEEASLLGRTVERLTFQYAKDYTLLFGVKDASVALEKAKEPLPDTISVDQINQAKRAILARLQEMYKEIPQGDAIQAVVQAQIDKTKKELGIK